MTPPLAFINLKGKRIRPETIARYEEEYYLTRLDKDGKFGYLEGTKITFKDGHTQVFTLPPEELDKLLEGTIPFKSVVEGLKRR